MYRIISRLLLFILPLSFSYSQSNVAVLEFQGSGVSKIDAVNITSRFSAYLFETGQVKLIERDAIQTILAEQNFQMTGCVASECAVEIGQLIGVQKVLAGTVSLSFGIYTLTVRMIDVESGEIVKQVIKDHTGSAQDFVLNSVKEAAYEMVDLSTPVAAVVPENARISGIQNPLGREGQGGTDQKKSVSGAMIRNLILPGWGHSYAGNKRRGKFFFWMFTYGVADYGLATMGVSPFESDEFGFTTFLISEGIAYIVGSIDAGVTTAKYNKSLEETK